MGKGHIRPPDSGKANRKFDIDRQHKVRSRSARGAWVRVHVSRGAGALTQGRGGARAREQEKTGQYNFKTGKRERDALKAGKGSGGPSKGSLWLLCIIVVFGALLLAWFVYYLAALELEGEEEVEADGKS
jgi:hypothetical protein